MFTKVWIKFPLPLDFFCWNMKIHIFAAHCLPFNLQIKQNEGTLNFNISFFRNTHTFSARYCKMSHTNADDISLAVTSFSFVVPCHHSAANRNTTKCTHTHTKNANKILCKSTFSGTLEATASIYFEVITSFVYIKAFTTKWNVTRCSLTFYNCFQ